jgi:hypothetical protein
MKIWLLALVVCTGVERTCEPATEIPFEYKTYHECTKSAYEESLKILFKSDITPDVVDSQRLFTKWSCIPVIKTDPRSKPI